jgi:putative sugar O-methyltransferase
LIGEILIDNKKLVPDNDLLNLMVADYREVGAMWQATEYWRKLSENLIEYFSVAENVLNFRGAPIRTGIRSYFPGNEGRFPSLTGRGRALERLVESTPILKNLIKYHKEVQNELIGQNSSRFKHKLLVSYLLLKEMYRDEKVLCDWMLGNPDDVIEVGDKYYSDRSLGYQFLYCLFGSHINLESLGSVVELGSGYGGQAEVFLRNKSNLKYIALDIPPWLYVAELYLKASFPGKVMGYRETRVIVDNSSIIELMGERSIAIVPNWKRPCLNDKFDLFWNAKSIQEMDNNAQCQLEMNTKQSENIFLHVYSPSKPKVHTPDDLRRMANRLGTHKEILFESDLFSGKDGYNIIFSR